MQILMYKENDPESLAAESISVLKSGGIVAYPTESFYALGVLATDETAVRRLFDIKKRPVDKPLPILVGNMDILRSIVTGIPVKAKALIERYWPGPLTLIFEARENIPELLTGGTGKVAVRIPGKSAALDLATVLKLPVTATSANISLMPPAEDLDLINKYFENQIDLIIDAGKAPGGRPSTIVDVTVNPHEILREGAVTLS